VPFLIDLIINEKYFMNTILIFNESVIIRSGIESLIKSNFTDSKTVFADNGKEVLTVLNSISIDVLVIDVGQNTKRNIFLLLQKIRSSFFDLKILVISEVADPIFALKFYKYGIDCYLLRNRREIEFVKVLTKMLKFNVEIVKEKVTNKNALRYDLIDIKKLSKREMEVALLLIKGKSNLDITVELGLTMQTISTYKKRILVKTETNNIVELVDFFSKRKVK
jgi:two-component system, NarL family, invasion response regulator UvrY